MTEFFWHSALLRVFTVLVEHTSRLRKNEVATYNAVQVWRLCG